MQNLFIKNRKAQKISVIVDKSQNQKGLAFVMHGLSGFKEQPHIAVFADAFKDSGFSVIRFDTTCTLGESNGKYENATITNYFEDLEDVIVNFIMSITENYNDYFEFEEVKEDNIKTNKNIEPRQK